MARRHQLWKLALVALAPVILQCGVAPDEPPALLQQSEDGKDLCPGCPIADGRVRLSLHLLAPVSLDGGLCTVEVEVRNADEPFAGVATASIPLESSTNSGVWSATLPPGAYRWQSRVKGLQAGEWHTFGDDGIAFVVPLALPAPPKVAPPPVLEQRLPPTARPDAPQFWTIGKVRIPVRNCGMPPSESCWEEWEKRLTHAQRRFYKWYCGQEENDYTDLCGGTPLVVVFDGRPVEFTEPGRFVLGPGREVKSAWPTARTPWLARDLNGNGIIDDATELFGSFTVLPSGETAADGFQALAALDEHRDGVIDGRDPAFGSLVLWGDTNGDRRCTADELTPASENLDSISLTFHDEPRCDQGGNCERQRSAMRFTDVQGRSRAGEVVDVWLRWAL